MEEQFLFPRMLLVELFWIASQSIPLSVLAIHIPIDFLWYVANSIQIPSHEWKGIGILKIIWGALLQHFL